MNPGLWHLMQLERRHHAPLPLARWLQRFALYAALSASLILGSLAAGMVGYHRLEGMSWLEAFLNAAMIMGGMGPVDELHTRGGKLFAGLYALYAGLIFITSVGLLAAPIAHRLLHRFHDPGDP